jgi:hypothetical protein
LISPEIVGTAYVENATPRAGSKRSTALMSPIVATWSRSSRVSRREEKRSAMLRESGRKRSMSWSRTAGSRVSW